MCQGHADHTLGPATLEPATGSPFSTVQLICSCKQPRGESNPPWKKKESSQMKTMV